MRDFTEEQALDSLRRKGVGIDKKCLHVDSGDLGIKELAKLDYLVNHRGYTVVFRREQNANL